jgi:hypothetical protein
MVMMAGVCVGGSDVVVMVGVVDATLLRKLIV